MGQRDAQSALTSDPGELKVDDNVAAFLKGLGFLRPLLAPTCNRATSEAPEHPAWARIGQRSRRMFAGFLRS